MIITTEVEDDVEDILCVFKKCGVDTSKAVFFVPQGMLSEQLRVRKICFPRWMMKGLIGKVLLTLYFLMVCTYFRPRLLVSGYSMFRHRLCSALLGSYHIAYIRGLIFASVDRGVSGRILKSKIVNTRWDFLFRPYHADLVLTISIHNKEIILNHSGITEDRLLYVRPQWLDNIQLGTKSPGKIYLTTQAFAIHGFTEIQEDQRKYLLSLLRKYGFSKDIVLRVHPRDEYDYDKDVEFAACKIDRRKPKEFLASLSSTDILISQLSTLAFEAQFLGVEVHFYCLDGLREIYSDWLLRKGVNLQKDGWVEINGSLFYRGDWDEFISQFREKIKSFE